MHFTPIFYSIGRCLTRYALNIFPVDDGLLLQGINQYRTSRNLTALNMTQGADCLANEIADTYKNKICTNTTPPYNTTLPKFSDYPGPLATCGLNTTNATADGQILPACISVSGQQPSLVLSNFTSNYATYLNSTQFSVIGIGSEDNWIVIVLTNTTAGGGGGHSGASGLTTISPLVFSIICFIMLV